MLDKGRASLAGTIGEYKYACPLDQEFLAFAGIDAEALLRELAAGKGDGDVLAWIGANARHPRNEAEVFAWSAYQNERGPGHPEKRAYFHELHQQYGPERSDITSWFDLLDLDDHVSFGGKA